jgi:hypothetical protein
MWVAAALAATSVQHVGTVSGDAIEWVSTWHSDADCVAIAAPFEPPPGFTLRGQELCREPGQSWRLAHTQRFPDEALRLPLPVGELQRIDLRGARFDPDPELGLLKGLGSWATTGVSARDRRALDRKLGRGRGSSRLYVRPAAIGPLVGHVGKAGPTTGARVGAVSAFVAIGLALAGLYRLLERRARVERIESWLAEHPTEL